MLWDCKRLHSDTTMYKMHVSFCYYCTIRITVSKTLTGTYVHLYWLVLETEGETEMLLHKIKRLMYAVLAALQKAHL